MTTGLEMFASVEGPALLWEDQSRVVIAANPRKIVQPHSAETLRDALQISGGGTAGFLGYGVSRWLERLPDRHDPLPIPDAVIMHFDEVRSFPPLRPTPLIPHPSSLITSDKWRSNCTRAEFESAVLRAKEAIGAGEAFQIVLSQRWETEFSPGEALSLYETLRQLNPSPYMFLLRTEECTLVGASPEMLVRVKGRTVETRPIAGTRPRGATPAEDAAFETELLADAKENAEHLMLVDLGRNDVGRVSERGSVGVTEFRSIERYSHVMHLVSHVRGTLRADLQPVDALLAAFPAGTVTGAPKIRAMELLDELEFSRRGPYAGAVVLADKSGLDSCIAIRTAVLHDNHAYVQAGAGIVYDSDPAREYEETVNKAAAVMRAVEASPVPRPASAGAPRIRRGTLDAGRGTS